MPFDAIHVLEYKERGIGSELIDKFTVVGIGMYTFVFFITSKL